MIYIINSPLFKEHNPLYDEDSLPPLGLGYIATGLEKAGHEVKLIDAIYERMPLKTLIDLLNNVKPHVVASNIFTTNYELVKELFESLKFKTHCIIGGLSTKQLYQKILDWNTANQVDIVTGDGELITPHLVSGTVTDKPFIKTKNRRVFIVDGSSAYVANDISNLPLNRSYFKNEPVMHPLGFMESNLVASRGCIYNCTFCAAARSLNKTYPVRERTLQSLIQELSEINSSGSGVQSIRVLDDLFLKNEKSVDMAIELFSQFNFQWRSMAHVLTFKNVTDNAMQKLKQSGCFELFIGIESGSPAILSSINKTKDLDTIVSSLAKAFKAGINIKSYFIYGFPNETEADMQMSFELAKKLKSLSEYYGVNFRTSVFQYRPYHGTQIYHELEKSGVDLNIQSVSPNKDLSSLVGRLQFNFHSGNYSNVADDVLHDYIYRTINLNDGEIFSGLKETNRL